MNVDAENAAIRVFDDKFWKRRVFERVKAYHAADLVKKLV
jgi:hypothetical protein